MAGLPGTFDSTQVDTGPDSFDPIPPGDYKVQIVQSEMRPTKNGNGQYLWLELDVIDGQHQGRKLWDRVNLVNPNPQAQQIGEKILAQICQATGELTASDSEQFHLKPMLAKVKVQPASGQYDASNQIKGYRSVNAEQQPGQTAQPAQAQPQAQTAQAAPQAEAKADFPWSN